MILEFQRVAGQRFEPPSHTHGRYVFEIKVISARSSTLEKISEVTSEVTFGTSFLFGSGSGLGLRYLSKVRLGVWLGKKSAFLTIPDFGLWASFARRYDARILSARTHSCTLKHFKQFFLRHSTQTLTQLKHPYPNPNQIEISPPKP